MGPKVSAAGASGGGGLPTPADAFIREDGVITAPPGGYPGATILVAASNSSTRARRVADYVCTGTNDDLVISETLAALGSAPGGVVLLAEGDYYEGDTGIQVLAGNQHLYGLGDRAGVIIHAGGSTPQMIQAGTSGTGNLYSNSVRHLTLDGSDGPGTCDGITASSNMFKCLDLYLSEIPQDAISLSSFISTEFAFQKIIDVNIYQPGRDGVVTDSNIYDLLCNGVTVSGDYGANGGRYGYNLAGSYLRLIGCRADDMMQAWGLVAQTTCFLLEIIGGHFDENGGDAANAGYGQGGNGGGGILILGNARATVTGVTFNSNDSYDAYLGSASNWNVVGCQSNGAGGKGPSIASVYATGCAGGTIADNNLVDLTSRAIVVAYSSGVSVHDNVITNPTTDPSEASIRLYAATGCQVHHNQLANGLTEENSSDYNLIEHNELNGGSISTVGAHTQVVSPPTSSSQLITFSGPVSSAAMPQGGAPATGTWAAGQTIMDTYGVLWICTSAGTPGTWKPCVVNPAALCDMQAWNFDAEGVSGGGATPAGSGAINMLAIQLPYTMTLNGLEFIINTAASGLTAGENFVGLYSSAGTRLAVSADCASYLETVGAQRIPFSAAASDVPGGPLAPPVYAALLFNGGTGPTVAKSPNSGAYTADNPSAPYRWGRTTSGGNTSMPSTQSPSSSMEGTYAFWVGVY